MKKSLLALAVLGALAGSMGFPAGAWAAPVNDRSGKRGRVTEDDLMRIRAAEEKRARRAKKRAGDV